MRILYSHRTKSSDGQAVHIRSLTEALVRRGHDLAIVGPDAESPGERPLDAAAGIGWRRHLPPAIHEAAELAYSVPAYWRLAARARAFAPDVLYERYNLYFHSGVRLARRRGLPFLLEVNSPLAEERERHGNLSLKSIARVSEASIWRAADRVLPVTQALASYVEKAGVDPARIEVIPNGVEAIFLRAHDPRPVRLRYGLEGKIVLGFTGFVREWHGLERVISYLGERRRSDVAFLIVGDGDARHELEKQALALGVKESVIFTGVVQREEVPAHLAAFDIALQPAVTAYASPLKLFEYMAAGRAILAPDAPNIREILGERGDAALLVAGDDAALFSALDALVADADLRMTLGAAARETLLRRGFTWDANAERVEKIAELEIARRLTPAVML
ncbi:MAG: glycosyltransferase family 4 protein [Parvularculaceae bacterium]|nr:glycosyltransferase family 4 protein [Parvularculaceae bacterium]